MAAWSRAQRGEGARGAAELHPAPFGVAFGRARKRLEAEQPRSRSSGPLVGSTAPDPAPIAAAVAAADAAPVVTAAPSLSGTMALGAQLPLSRLPFAAGRVLPAQAYEAAVEHARVVQGPDRGAARPGATVGLSDAGPPPAGPMALGLGVGLRRASLEETAGLPAGIAEPAFICRPAFPTHYVAAVRLSLRVEGCTRVASPEEGNPGALRGSPRRRGGSARRLLARTVRGRPRSCA